MTDLTTWTFWMSVACLAYVYAGFPLLVAVVAWFRRRTVQAAPATPSVSLIIAAYDEEAVIGDRLENALALDYPAGRLEILVAADGCSDGTEAIVERYADRGVRLLSLPRQGKIRALNAAAAQATGELLVFSDANIMCHPQALRMLARNFADPAVGGVAGHTVYRLEEGSESSSQGESLYWDYDTRLKQLESLTGNIVSAHGGLYAVRRSLYRPVADTAVTDDFAISTEVVAQGYRLVFEPAALASEVAVPEARREFCRRVRLMTRGLRGVVLRRRLLNPLRFGFYSVVLFSHKVLRRLALVPLVLIAGTSAYLAPTHPFYFSAAAAQALFYALAVVGLLLRRTAIGRLKPIYIPFYYCMANVASGVALVQLLTGRRIELWQPQRHPAIPAGSTGARR
ncbi:MAG: glycosyltransferase family 2 protein [Acidobacteria bacterium]|nr:MAG: glycosyltransferase family 2 protein [Acidobacteriota bacterium]